MTNPATGDIPRVHADRPTVATNGNGSIHPRGTALSTPYLDGPTPTQRAERAPWRAEAAVEMLSTAFLRRGSATPFVREVLVPLILLVTGIQVSAVVDDDPATGSLPLLAVLVPAAVIALYVSRMQWVSSHAHVRAAIAWARSAPVPRRSWGHDGGPGASPGGAAAPGSDDVVRPGVLPAVGQWLRITLPRRLPGLIWAALAPPIVTTLARAYAPAPFQETTRLAGTALVLGVVLGGLIDNLVLSARLGRARSAVGLTGLETGAWTLAQRFTDDPLALPEEEAVVPRRGTVCARLAGINSLPDQSRLVEVTVLDAQMAVLRQAADDVAGPGAPWAESRPGGLGADPAVGPRRDVARARRALADLLASARAVTDHGHRVFQAGYLLTFVFLLYLGARPWATGDVLAWRTITPVILSAGATLLGVAMIGTEVNSVVADATTEQFHLRALRDWAASCRLHAASGWAEPAWMRDGRWNLRRRPARMTRRGLGLWVLILLVVGVLAVGWTAGETPASLSRSVASLRIETLRSWGLGEIELGALCAVGLGVWALPVVGCLRWGREVRRLEETLLSDGLARISINGDVVVDEASSTSVHAAGTGRGSAAVLGIPDEALVEGPGAWASDVSAMSSGVAAPWECGVAVERLSRLAANRRRDSRGGWLPLHVGLLALVLAIVRLGAGRGWILGVLVAALGGLMVVSGVVSFLRDVILDARVRRSLLAWAREARGPWAWPGVDGPGGESGGGAIATWWDIDGKARPASFFVVMGETSALWWLLAPSGAVPAATETLALFVLALPALTWLISMIRFALLAASAHRARAAVGLPGRWRVQDRVEAGERTTTTVPGWQALGKPVPAAGGAVHWSWGR